MNFNAGFGLSLKEDTESFTWLLAQLKNAATKAAIPDLYVIITDFDVALKKAASDIFY